MPRQSLADFTAGGESHPALKILFSSAFKIAWQGMLVNTRIVCYYDIYKVGWVIVTEGAVSVLGAGMFWGIRKPWIWPEGEVSVISPPITWSL